jgi:hypothetical protein
MWETCKVGMKEGESEIRKKSEGRKDGEGRKERR